MHPLIDRTQAPAAGSLTNISLPNIDTVMLSNGIKLHTIQHGNVEVVTLQVIFNAGKRYQSKAGLADFTARNMQEGTHSYTGLELAQELDEYGGWMSHQTGVEYISFQLTTLSPHISQCLPLLREVLFEPTFPEDKFDRMKQRTLQKLSVESQKTRFHAKRLFGQLMYGQAHPYGTHVGQDEIKQLTLAEIIQYHKSFFYPGNFMLTAVGNFDQKVLTNMLDEVFGQMNLQDPVSENSVTMLEIPAFQPGRNFYQIEGMQATIRLGHTGFKRSHPDYHAMQVVNTILGGYFGSRLMQNIREEKGYTYGINSGWVSMRHSGYFVVQSDVGNEYVESTIEEVKNEMKKLATVRITNEEMELVKNYLLGQSINQRETPFQLSDLLRFSLVSGISFEEIDQKFPVIKQIQPEDILRLSQEYFRPDELLEVVCGDQ